MEYKDFRIKDGQAAESLSISKEFDEKLTKVLKELNTKEVFQKLSMKEFINQMIERTAPSSINELIYVFVVITLVVSEPTYAESVKAFHMQQAIEGAIKGVAEAFKFNAFTGTPQDAEIFTQGLKNKQEDKIN